MHWLIAGLLATLASAPPTLVKAAVTAYYDADGNGLREAHEVGVPGVLISDGDHLWPTDSDGRARLEIPLVGDEPRHVWVLTPGGHRCTTGWYVRLEPKLTDAQPCLFGLQPLSERSGPYLAVTGDPQVTVDDASEVGRRLVSELAPPDAAPSFIAVLGDLTEHGGPDELAAWRNAVRHSPVPVHEVFGWHDGRATDPPGIEAFERLLGPAWYAFWSGGHCFVVLVTETSCLTGQQQARQTRWLRRLVMRLPANSELVVLAHIPPARPELQILSERQKLRAVIYGHWHENSVWRLGDLPLIATGPFRGDEWGAGTATFRRISLSQTELSAPIFDAGLRRALSVLAPSALEPPPLERCRVRVFAGDSTVEVVSVEAFAPGGPPISLQRTGLGTWEGDLPGARPQKLTVQATGRGGETWRREVRVGPTRTTPEIDLSTFAPPPKAPLVRVWMHPTGARCPSAGAPVIWRDRVFVALPDDGLPAAPAVVALDARTGRRLWRTPARGSVRSDVVVRDTAVFSLSHLNVVQAFDAQSGRELWHRELTPDPPGRHRNSRTGLAVAGDVILAQIGGGPLAVLDPATGNTIAKPRIGGALYTSPATADDRVLLVTAFGWLALARGSWDELWRLEPPGGLPRHGPPVVNGRLGFFVADEVRCVDLADGRLRWSVPLPTVGLSLGAVTVDDGVVYTPGPRPLALREATGAPVWRDAVPAAGYASAAPAVTRQQVFTTADDGRLLAYDRETGNELWRADLGVPLKTAPRVKGNLLVVLDAFGNVHGLTSAEGSP